MISSANGISQCISMRMNIIIVIIIIKQTLDVSLRDTIPYEHAIPDPSEPLEKKPRTKEVICEESSDDDRMNGGDLEYICGPGCAYLFEPHRNG